MYDYYIKIKEGFEFCKKNLEGKLTPLSFQSTTELCKNYIDLCESYKSIVKKKCTKRDYKYISDIVEWNTNELARMIPSWENQYKDYMEEEDREEQKANDTYNALNIQNEYQQQLIKNRVKVGGFMKYLPKKKKKKPNPKVKSI